jgi:hypothetical protein
MVRSARRAVAVCVLTALSFSLVSFVALAPATAVASLTLTRARAFVVSQQQSDGGFEVGHFPSFETPDAVLALAELAQTGSTWNTAAARSAVSAVVSRGRSALDYADDQAESPGLTSALAAKYLTLVVEPLGLNPRDFDPSNDSVKPVDLVAAMGKGADLDGQYRKPAFNGLLFIALAHWSIDCAVPGDLVARIKAAQQPNGSWDFSGAPSGKGVDIDTTSLAVIALTRSGLPSTDPAIARALTLLARQHRANGAWQASAFPPAVDDPNTTSLATLAIAATGQAPGTAGWRNRAAPELAGQPYVSPDVWLRSQQKPDGHIASPNDSFGVTTFATTQSIEALTRTWFTSKAASTTRCPLPGGPREKFLRAEFQTLAARVGTNAELQPAANALGADPTNSSKRLAAVTSTLSTDAYRRAAVAELYQRTLGRSPDGAGSTYWAGRLRTLGRQSVVAYLLASGEFLHKAGGTSTGYLTRVYPVVFGRPLDPSGKAHWLRLLAAGASRRSVAAALLTSPEGRRYEVAGLYIKVLGRAADSRGLTYWAGRLGVEPVERLIARFASSAEYFSRATG